MKKTAILIALIFSPTLANAAAASTASLQNFSFSVISGTAPTFNLSDFEASLYTQINSGSIIDTDIVTGLSTPYTFDITATSQDIQSYAFADGDSDIPASIKTQTGSTGGDAYAESDADVSFNYVANSLLKFTIDATITGHAQNSGDYAYSFAGLGLYIESGLNGGYDYFQGASLTAEAGNIFNNQASYSLTKTLTFYYYSDQNAVLYLGANAESTAFAVAVPEPESYALMLAGLGFVGFAARRRQAA